MSNTLITHYITHAPEKSTLICRARPHPSHHPASTTRSPAMRDPNAVEPHQKGCPVRHAPLTLSARIVWKINIRTVAAVTTPTVRVIITKLPATPRSSRGMVQEMSKHAT